MKFTETRNNLRHFEGAETPDYQMKYISSEVWDFLDGLNNHYVEPLTLDILQINQLDYDLKEWLGKTYYPASNDYALECLELAPTIKHLWGRKIKPWTDAALKCFDNFLLKYIQEDLGHRFRMGYGTRRIRERDVYWHMTSLGSLEGEIGKAFHFIYQLRSSFHHIQIQEKDGVRIPKRYSNAHYNRKRDIIMRQFGLAVGMLDLLINLREIERDKNGQEE